MKGLAERLSDQMGYGGEVNTAVMEAGTAVLNRPVMSSGSIDDLDEEEDDLDDEDEDDLDDEDDDLDDDLDDEDDDLDDDEDELGDDL